MKIKCEYCHRTINVDKITDDPERVCDKPLMYALFANCNHCGCTQPVFVLDLLQKHYAMELGKVNTEIHNLGKKAAMRPNSYASLLDRRADLTKKITTRNNLLMKRFKQLKKEGKLINGK